MELGSLVSLVMTLVSVASGTRCYMCRDVTQRVGNRPMFLQRYRELEDQGWIVPCKDYHFEAHPQVSLTSSTFLYFWYAFFVFSISLFFYCIFGMILCIFWYF